MTKYIGIGALLIGIGIIAFVIYENSPFAHQTRVFSSYSLLESSWDKYKTTCINHDGRVVDASKNYVTTSEGQSYALLRSVWIDDKPTFDSVWNWSKNNLQLPSGLFGWQWGKRSNGSYGFIENGGNNPASDADSDIALALILASRRWHQPTYQDQAKKILTSIWTQETATASGGRYMIAGPWANATNTLVINPSYFAPYAWRIFAQVDTADDWGSLIHPAYTFLTKVGEDKLDKENAVGFPPDWVAMDKKTGTLLPTTNSQYTTHYGYDAMRVPWRIAVDYIWNKDPQAKAYLTSSFAILKDTYQKNGQLPALFGHDGSVLQNNEIPLMYATSLGYFMVVDQEDAQKIYQDKILQLYSNDDDTFKSDLGYYDQNWLWFGAALFNKKIVSY